MATLGEDVRSMGLKKALKLHRKPGGVLSSTARKVGNEADMLEVVEGVLAEDGAHGLHSGAPLEDYLRISGGKPAYRMEFFKAGFQIASVQGVLTPQQFSGMVRSSLLWHLQNVRTRQPGQWRIVGVSVHEGFKMRSGRVSTGITEDQSAVSPMEGGIPQRNKQQTRPGQASRDPRLEVRCAVVDIAQGDPVDLVFERHGKRTSSMHKYAETGLLRHIPGKLARRRAQAIEVLKEYGDLADNIEETLFELDDGAKAKILKLKEHLDMDELSRVVNVPVESIRGFLDSEKKDVPSGRK